MPDIAAAHGSFEDGYFYHSIDLPGLPTIGGAWDLRPNVNAYFGGIELSGKRVLEVGAANGFLTFHMERCGAEVVPYDLSPDRLGDIMTFPGLDRAAFEGEYRSVVAGLNKAWHHAQRAFGSSLSLRHGTAYEVSADLGEVDITTFGSILLHLRDPYTALAAAARVTREKIVVTDLFNSPHYQPDSDADREARAIGMIFNPTRNQDPCAWWSFTPGAIESLLLAVGFGKTRTTFHEQLFRTNFSPWGATALDRFQGCTESAALFTIVAERL